ncbi:MAG: fatty acid desaturase [Paenibacillus sp.]|nr:fatty acid desaturase [Paenibacillus sp.]
MTASFLTMDGIDHDEEEKDIMSSRANKRDYSITGAENALAQQRGLASAEWYATPIPRRRMKELMQRRNGPAIRDTLLWFALIIGSGALAVYSWGTWWAVAAFALYGILHTTPADSRWHECGHGTAFKTPWMNEIVYQIASFLILRSATPWRWSHSRHHSDTYIVGRDPEILTERPPVWKVLVMEIAHLYGGPIELKRFALHCFGKVDKAENEYIPESERGKTYREARIYLLIFICVIGCAVYWQTWLPVLLVGLPSFYGTIIVLLLGMTQHLGLHEDVLDHRLNTRTIYMNGVMRFLYWNMNYHIEHHMFPMVPYHALPALHKAMKHDCPPASPGFGAALKEVFAALWKQRSDPSYTIERPLPATAQPYRYGPNYETKQEAHTERDGWIVVGEAAAIGREDVIRFDYGQRTFAVYRTDQDEYFATDGLCTHGNGKVHLADGLVAGHLIECPKHNGRFDVKTGEAKRVPACKALQTYPVQIVDGSIRLYIAP